MNPAALADLAATALRRWRMGSAMTGYIGWAGHRNLGDDAMFAAARGLLPAPVELLRNPTRERALARIGAGGQRFSRVVLGGGTLMNAGYLPIVEQCIAMGLPLATLGTGIGSAGFSMAEEGLDPRWQAALARFSHIGVRGPRSLAKLRAAGVTNGEIVGDLALALTPDAPLADWGAKRLLFNAAPSRLASDSADEAAMRRGLARLLREAAAQGWQVVPLAFDPEDFAAIRAIITEAGIAAPPPVQPRDWTDWAGLAQGATLSLGVRLHSAVLAASAGIAPLLVGYRDKCADFAESLGMAENVVPMAGFDEARLMDRFTRLAENPQGAGQGLHTAALGHRAALRAYAARLSQG